MNALHNIPTPAYVIDENRLRRNLALLRSVKERAGVDIILAFKAYSLWKTFPIIKEYIDGATASSAWEAQLAVETMGSKAHSYAPAYTDQDFPLIRACSSHITFNSLTQFERFYPSTLHTPEPVSCGLRINPEYSEVATDLYNPAAAGSRLGVVRAELGHRLPRGVAGLHFHTLCESSSHALERTLEQVKIKFGDWLSQLQWLNMGGGHLITGRDYDVEHLIQLLQSFQAQYPHLHIILEPGAAFVWQTGALHASVVDIVRNGNIQTAILDVSFACHMPDCLEMPYKPVVRQAHPSPVDGKPRYRLGGNSCLSGDFIGDWTFDTELKTGDPIVFEDMIHYTTVKTTLFNGVRHPDLCLRKADGSLETLRHFSYEDYKHRMS
jgi:carboxynorspermidine decarboxylase